MTVFEILNFNRELLGRIQNAGIRLDDCRYISSMKNQMRQLSIMIMTITGNDWKTYRKPMLCLQICA